MKVLVEFLFSIVMNSGTAVRPAVRKLRQLGHLLLALGLALVPIAGKAGELNLSSAPLFLGSTTEPNITFVSDDSGSMDWDITILGNQGRFTITGRNRSRTYSYTMCEKGTNNSCQSSAGKWDNTYSHVGLRPRAPERGEGDSRMGQRSLRCLARALLGL